MPGANEEIRERLAVILAEHAQAGPIHFTARANGRGFGRVRQCFCGKSMPANGIQFEYHLAQVLLPVVEAYGDWRAGVASDQSASPPDWKLCCDVCTEVLCECNEPSRDES